MTPPVRLCIVGGPLDTGNLGVSALGVSTVAGAVGRLPGCAVTLFDNGVGRRTATVALPRGRAQVELRGMRLSRRVHRAESLWRMEASSRLSATMNPNVAAMAHADAVWDISGGDSFSDIYGPRRFRSVTMPKVVALRRARRLVLLPQTYGPFSQASNRDLARRIVIGADSAWARDADSFAQLRELAGDDFDPARHREAVDVAFTLPVVEPDRSILGDLAPWFDPGHPPMVGINVSGLLHAEPDAARSRFGLAGDYPAAMQRLVRRFLDETDARVVLIPHVLGNSEESDVRACHRLRATVAASHGNRIATLPTALDATTTKWAISMMDWMTGARMHATIAALSTRTPVTGIAYSHKMPGVFGSCGVRSQVVDARTEDTVDLVDGLWQGWESRAGTRELLESHVDGVVDRAHATFDHLASQLEGVHP